MIDKDPKVKSTEEKATARLTPEQSALLAGAGMVDSNLTGDIPHDGQGNLIEAGAEPQVDKLQQNRDMLNMLIGMASPALPFLRECYTPEVIGNIAGAFTAVEEKYGWDASSMIGPEIALALFAIPPSITAYTLGKRHFAELKARREAEQAGKPPKQAQGDAREHALGAN